MHQPGKLCKNRREYIDIFAIDFLSVAYRFIIAPNSTNNNTNKNTTNNIKSNCLQITSINHYIGMTNLSSTQLFWKIRNMTSAVVFADYVVAHTVCSLLKHKSIRVFLDIPPVLQLYRCLAVFVDCKHTDSIPVLHSIAGRLIIYLYCYLLTNFDLFGMHLMVVCISKATIDNEFITQKEKREEKKTDVKYAKN